MEWRDRPLSRIVALAALLLVVPGTAAARASDAGEASDPGTRAEGQGFTYRRNFLIPSLEVPAFVALSNLSARLSDKEWAETRGLSTFWDHLWHGPWQFDGEDLRTNFLTHPYVGSVYHNLARSSGLSEWWSFGYSIFGSLLWELGGENSPPSINDQLITPIGGFFIGEVLYRSFVLILQTDGGSPGFWRELAAFLVSPSAGFNRLLFGDTYRTREFDERPPVFAMVSGGAGYSWLSAPVPGRSSRSGWGGTAALELVYGQPADPEFRPRRPFSSFRLDARLNEEFTGLGTQVLLRGLLGGWRMDGGAFRGVFGIFGEYANLSGGVYRFAGAGAGLGITGEIALSRALALQTTAVLAGIPIGAGDTTGDLAMQPGNYHLGPGAQLALELRLVAGERAFVDLTAQQLAIYGVSEFPGRDALLWSRLTAGVRITGPHCLTATATVSAREAKTRGMPNLDQDVVSVAAGYLWTSDRAFGVLPVR